MPTSRSRLVPFRRPAAPIAWWWLTYAYYQDGQVPRRLHDEVIAPARTRGYREIWLCGASMGGMGVLLHDLAYPGTVNGMVLLAPYLGERELLEEISAAGGLTRRPLVERVDARHRGGSPPRERPWSGTSCT